jgi:Zn-dependent M28 family amino/carboxypeptidase
MFIAFGGEEIGLLGSAAYVRKPLVPLEQTKFLLNLDLMGNGTEGITAVAAVEFPAEYERLVRTNDELKAVPTVKSRGNAPNSDHYHFVSKGVHGLFIYTLGGPPHYHDVNDTGEALQFSKYPELMGLFSRFLAEF